MHGCSILQNVHDLTLLQAAPLPLAPRETTPASAARECVLATRCARVARMPSGGRCRTTRRPKTRTASPRAPAQPKATSGRRGSRQADGSAAQRNVISNNGNAKQNESNIFEKTHIEI
eukprot:6214141-Pleurochrysis_carterae.AAC.1